MPREESTNYHFNKSAHTEWNSCLRFILQSVVFDTTIWCARSGIHGFTSCHLTIRTSYSTAHRHCSHLLENLSFQIIRNYALLRRRHTH